MPVSIAEYLCVCVYASPASIPINILTEEKPLCKLAGVYELKAGVSCGLTLLVLSLLTAISKV